MLLSDLGRRPADGFAHLGLAHSEAAQNDRAIEGENGPRGQEVKVCVMGTEVLICVCRDVTQCSEKVFQASMSATADVHLVMAPRDPTGCDPARAISAWAVRGLAPLAL